jgi:hypothetical protein
MENNPLLVHLKELSILMTNLSETIKTSGKTPYLGNTKIFQAKFFPDILSENWEGINRSTDEGLTSVEEILTSLKKRQEPLNKISETLEKISSDKSKNFTFVTKRKEWPTLKKEIIAQLLDHKMNQEQIDKQIDFLEQLTKRKLNELFKKQIVSYEKYLNKLFISTLSHYMGNLYSHSRY